MGWVCPGGWVCVGSWGYVRGVCPEGDGEYVRGWVYHGTWDTYPHQYWHLITATKTGTVGKRVVRILLECFLVFCIGLYSVGDECWEWKTHLLIQYFCYICWESCQFTVIFGHHLSCQLHTFLTTSSRILTSDRNVLKTHNVRTRYCSSI